MAGSPGTVMPGTRPYLRRVALAPSGVGRDAHAELVPSLGGAAISSRAGNHILGQRRHRARAAICPLASPRRPMPASPTDGRGGVHLERGNVRDVPAVAERSRVGCLGDTDAGNPGTASRPHGGERRRGEARAHPRGGVGTFDGEEARGWAPCARVRRRACRWERGTDPRAQPCPGWDAGCSAPSRCAGGHDLKCLDTQFARRVPCCRTCGGSSTSSAGSAPRSPRWSSGGASLSHATALGLDRGQSATPARRTTRQPCASSAGSTGPRECRGGKVPHHAVRSVDALRERWQVSACDEKRGRASLWHEKEGH